MAGVPVLVPALFASNGASPASGAKLYAYIKGTNTPQTFYTDEAIATPAANPTIASSLGATVRYLDPSLSYDLVAKTSDEATTLFSVTFNALVQNVVLGTGWDTVLGLPAAGTLDNLNGIRSVATYAALTALTTATGLSDNSTYFTYARATEEDGGAGFWRYDSASTATANGGTVLAIDGGGAGRFFRQYEGQMQAGWFGLKGDNATDNSATLETALSALATPISIKFPFGNFVFNSPVDYPQGKDILLEGEGKGTKFISAAGADAMFKYGRTSAQTGGIMRFRNCQIEKSGTAKQVGSIGISSRGFADAQDDNQLFLDGVYFFNFEKQIDMKWTNYSRVSNCWFQGGKFSFSGERGVAFANWIDCRSFDDGMWTVDDSTEDAYTNRLSMVACEHVTGTLTSVFVRGVQLVELVNCVLDLGSAGDAAFYAKTCQDINIFGGYFSSNPSATSRDGIWLETSRKITIVGTTITDNEVGIRVTGGALNPQAIVDGNRFNGNDYDILISDVAGGFNGQANTHNTDLNGQEVLETGTCAKNAYSNSQFRNSSFTVLAGSGSVTVNNMFDQPA
jgi:hypothetical protein